MSYRKGEELSDQNLQLLSLTAPSLIKDTLNTPLINDCDLYFFRCVLRSAALNSALSTPSKVSEPHTHIISYMIHVIGIEYDTCVVDKRLLCSVNGGIVCAKRSTV